MTLLLQVLLNEKALTNYCFREIIKCNIEFRDALVQAALSESAYRSMRRVYVHVGSKVRKKDSAAGRRALRLFLA